LLNSPCHDLTITVSLSGRWTPSFSVPRLYDTVASLCHLFLAATIASPRPHGPTIIEPRVATTASLRQPLPQMVLDDCCGCVEEKNESPPTVFSLPSLASFRARHHHCSLFSLRLVFGQTATNPSLLSASLLVEQAIPPSSSTTSRRSLEEDQEKNSTFVLSNMDQFLELLESLCWTLVGMYLCITGRICLLLVFHVHIHHPLPHSCVESMKRAPCIFCPV
jgi:hypothetical protein